MMRAVYLKLAVGLTLGGLLLSSSVVSAQAVGTCAANITTSPSLTNPTVGWGNAFHQFFSGMMSPDAELRVRVNTTNKHVFLSWTNDIPVSVTDLHGPAATY